MTQSGNRLQKDQEQEVAVRHFAKLDEEVLGEECETSVLGSGDQVVRELSIVLIPIKDSIDLKYAALFSLIIVNTFILTHNFSGAAYSIVTLLLCFRSLYFTVMPRALCLFSRAL